MSVPRVFTLTAIVVGLTFWSAPAASTAAQLPSQAAMSAPAGLPENEHLAFIQSVQSALTQARFAALDETAEELRRTKARFPGGDWKLFHFYAALGRPGVKEDETYSDEAWEKHIAALRLWRVQRENSESAAIALGEAWTYYAWKARGAGRSNTVTEEMQRTFQQRLIIAEKALAAAWKISTTNPHWYRASMVLARGQGWERSDADALFADAIKIEPLYLQVYAAYANYLLPRWYGDKGDWLLFADLATRNVGGREGAVIYSQIAWRVSAVYGANQFFRETEVSWPRVRQAFVDREALYGTNRETLNTFCLLAAAAEDKRTTRILLARIGEDWDPEVWKTRERFDQYRTWAAEN